MEHDLTDSKRGRAIRGALACVALGLAGGCSDTDATDMSLPGGKFAIAMRVADSESNTNTFVAFVDSLLDGPPVTLDGALELNTREGGHSGGNLYPGHKPGAFFIYAPPALDRYEATTNGTFQKTGALSFAAQGVTGSGSPGFIQVFSEAKAYLFSNETFEVIVWNPSTMTIEKTLPIPIQKEALPATFTFGVGQRRGNQVVFGAWFSDFEAETVLDLNYIFVVDADRDEFVGVSREERCGGIISLMTGGDGTIYLSPDVWTAAIHRLDPSRAPKPCLLRMLPGQNVPDPDYKVDLEEFTGSPFTAGLTSAGGDNAYFYVLDEETAAIDSMSTANVLHGGPAWRWVHANLVSKERRTPTSSLLGGTHLSFDVGADVITYTAAADAKESTLLKTNVSGDPQRGRVVPGVPTKIIAIQ